MALGKQVIPVFDALLGSTEARVKLGLGGMGLLNLPGMRSTGVLDFPFKDLQVAPTAGGDIEVVRDHLVVPSQADEDGRGGGLASRQYVALLMIVAAAHQFLPPELRALIDDLAFAQALVHLLMRR
jgi:hypothetical protein